MGSSVNNFEEEIEREDDDEPKVDNETADFERAEEEIADETPIMSD